MMILSDWDMETALNNLCMYYKAQFDPEEDQKYCEEKYKSWKALILAEFKAARKDLLELKYAND